jgi:ADP-ribosylglycohydrolase
MTDALAERFTAVVVAARVGDSMGSPTENLAPEEIDAAFGWVRGFSGDGTDDSLMANLLATALIDSDGNAGADEWAAQWVTHYDEMIAERDRFLPSVLHTAKKLRSGWLPRQVADGNMASSSSAMCVWPVGLVNAGNPRAAAEQAYRVAKLIHVGTVDFCQDAAAMVAAAVAAAFRPEATALGACRSALSVLDPASGTIMRELADRALSLVLACSGYADFRDCYHAAFRQVIPCDARETVPAALALTVLADGDPRTAVEQAANFGRDTDTIATMAGAVCAALSGPASIPRPWLDTLGKEAVTSARRLGERLARTARAKAASRQRDAAAVAGLLPAPPGETMTTSEGE